MIIEGYSPRRALSKSVRRTRQSKRNMVGIVYGAALLVAGIPLAVSMAMEHMGGMVISFLPEVYVILVPVMAGVVVFLCCGNNLPLLFCGWFQ
ncbi:MAG: hypothetical protein ACQEQ4_09560 [Fibrobacterota bacterium]